MPEPTGTDSPTEPCKVKSGEVAVVTDDNVNCSLDEGATLRLFYEISTENPSPHVDPAPLVPAPRHEPKASSRLSHTEATMPEVPAPVEQPHVPAPAPVAHAPAPEASPAPVAPAPEAPPVAQTTQPDTTSAASELAALKDIGGGDSTLTIVLALIAVVGGAAGWKFWNKFSEQKHEQKMKQMEIDAQAQGLGNAQPIPCQSVSKVQAEAIASLKAQVEELQAKVSKVEKKSLSLGSFDAEELEEWQKKVDKDLKALKAAKSRAGGA